MHSSLADKVLRGDLGRSEGTKQCSPKSRQTFWGWCKELFSKAGGCHACGAVVGGEEGKIAIVGSPNVGKSTLFNALTGGRAIISNYPGTTVDVLRGNISLDGRQLIVVDTPGMYSLLPITEDERIARSMLFLENPHAVVQVVDAKDLERFLVLTFQLLEAELPVILVLNMVDEAEAAGIHIDTAALQRELGVPVVATVATSGRGVGELKKVLENYVCRRPD